MCDNRRTASQKVEEFLAQTDEGEHGGHAH